VVEGGLIRHTAVRITDAEIEKFRRLVSAGFALTSDPVGFRVLDQEFHTLLMKIAGNPVLELVATSLYQLGMEFRRVASETAGVIERSAVEHDLIAQALEARDAAKAEEAMRAHLTSINRTTFEAMQKVAGQSRPARGVA
jgi:GntR family transcriptional repressor for pyruvate dehydrogenase complex